MGGTDDKNQNTLSLVRHPFEPAAGAAGLVVVLLADVGWGWASLLTNSIVVALGPILVYLHTIFPERLDFRGRKALLGLLWAIGLSLMGAVGLGRLVYHAAWATPAINASKAFFVACLLLAVALMVRALVSPSSRGTRRQIGFIVLGTVLALAPLVIFILLPQIVPNLRYLTIWPAFLALVCIPSSYLYAIFRHDLMRLDRVVSQNVARLVLFLLLVALYLPAYWLLHRLAALALPGIGDPMVRSGLASVVLIVLLIASFQPLRWVTERVVYWLFYGEWYDYKSFVSRMTRELGEAMDMQTVAGLLVDGVAGTMRLKAVALLLPGPDDQDRFCTTSAKGFDPGVSSCESSGLPGALLMGNGVLSHRSVRERAHGSEAAEAVAAWGDAGAQWWIPLAQQGRLEGALVVGAKKADEFLTREDLDILDTLSHHAASAIARARQLKQLHAQAREIRNLSRKLLTAKDEIQEQIALELHAEAMPDIVAVSRLLERARREYAPEEVEKARERLQEILDYLRALMYELRPPVLSLSNLGEMLQQHALSCQRRWGLSIAVQVGADHVGVSEEIRNAVFRVFRESLNNAHQHAAARAGIALQEAGRERDRGGVCAAGGEDKV